MKKHIGSRLVSPQDNYIVIDTETTGFDISSSEIIELAAVKVVSGEVADTFQSLVKPVNSIPLEVTYINGITNDMVKDAPGLESVLSRYLDFLGDSVLVGHNINGFDLNILGNASLNLYGITLSNDFVDTMYLARCCIHGLESYALSSIADYLQVQVRLKHRALDDCITTYKCYEKMKHMELKNYFTNSNSKKGPRWRNKFSIETLGLRKLQEIICSISNVEELSDEDVTYLAKWIESNSNLSGNYLYDKIRDLLNNMGYNELLCELQSLVCPVSKCERSEEIELKGKTVCLTGDFELGSKEEVEKILASMGAICKSSVIKSTDILIVGGLGSKAWSFGTYGSKVMKAMELNEKGCNILIVHENEIFK